MLIESARLRASRWLVIVVVSLTYGLLAETARAQDRSEFQNWSAVGTTARLSEKTPALALWFDAHVRRGNSGTLNIFRPALGVILKDWVSLWAGYAWIPRFLDEDFDPLNEHRPWQQAILKFNVGEGMSLQSRTRFEQRFSEAGDEVGFRIRQFFRFGWQPSAQVPAGLVIWDELFLGLNETDWGAVSGFDQNRLFVGPFVALVPWARLEMGYLANYLSRDEDTLAHVFSTSLSLSYSP